MKLLVHFTHDANDIEKMLREQGPEDEFDRHVGSNLTVEGADLIVTTDGDFAMEILESGGPRVLVCSKELREDLPVRNWQGRLVWSQIDAQSIRNIILACHSIRIFEMKLEETLPESVL